MPLRRHAAPAATLIAAQTRRFGSSVGRARKAQAAGGVVIDAGG
jgi:hypothetical protein